MHNQNFKNEILTIPNLLSIFRLLLIPVYITIYLNSNQPSDYFLAATILTVSCLTDLIDGQIARRFNMITDVGKFLDPLADKLTQFSLILCLSVRHASLLYVVVLFFIKEMFQLIAYVISVKKGLTMTGSFLAGKICTTVLFMSLILLVLLPNIPVKAVHLIVIVDSTFLIIAFLRYAYAFLSKKAKRKLFIKDEEQ